MNFSKVLDTDKHEALDEVKKSVKSVTH